MRKIVVLGGAQSGKSSLLRRHIHKHFQPNEQPTLGLNVIIPTDADASDIQFWDASGQSRFNSLAFTSLSGADAILLCYDVCNLGSFLEVRDFWLPKLHEQSNVPICLLGTHLDAANERRQVTAAETAALMAAHHIGHGGECSAKTGQGMEYVQTFLQQVPTRIIPSFDEEHSPRALIQESGQGISSLCCCPWRRRRKPIEEGEEIALE
jgi:small GTP-binding protein